MKSSKQTITPEIVATPLSRKLILRVLLVWMFIVFAYWMITNHLPSQHLFTDETKAQLPSYLNTLSDQHFKSYRMVFEIIFSVSLLIMLFSPSKKLWLIVHFITAVLFGISQYVITGAVPIPLTAYIVLLIAFFFQKEEKFSEAFDFLLNIIVVLIILYAATYFVRWYDYFHTPFYHYMIKPKAEDYTWRDKVLTTVMPWFYCLFAVLGIKIFTPAFNKILLIFCLFLLITEFVINRFFDPGLTFMLFPFINWKKLSLRFNKQ